MSRLVRAVRGDARPDFALDTRTQLALAAAILALQVLWLAAMGRPFLAPGGDVLLWVGDPYSPDASQQGADWYSLLHVVFGFGLLLFLDWMKPDWSLGQKLLVALASSAVWEIVENTPAVVSAFGNASGSPPYAGDSILNALADTGFVALGFLAARAMPVPLVLALALAAEALVWHMAGDGYTLGSLRLVGVPV